MTLSATPSYTITLESGTYTTDGQASLLDAALASGVPAPFSCQRGECGSCRAQVVAGSYARMVAPTERSYVPAHGELLMCQCRAASDLTLRFAHWQAPEQAPQRREATVVSRRQLTPDVTELIVDVQGAAAFDHRAGQHVQWLLDDGGRRSFSIANAPRPAGPGAGSASDTSGASDASDAPHTPDASNASIGAGRSAARLEFHIRRQPGGRFTDGVLPALRPGDAMTLEGPYGACVWPASLPDGVQDLVLLATGTGFAGVFPILMAALESRTLRSITLYWGARQEDDCYAAGLLNALQGKDMVFRWHAVVSGSANAAAKQARNEQDAAADGQEDAVPAWAAAGPARTDQDPAIAAQVRHIQDPAITAQARHVQDRAIAADHDWTRALVYACGNPAMVHAARQQLLAAGLPDARFHAEAFLPSTDAAPAGASIAPAPAAPAHPWERVSARFTLAGILQARERSIAAVHEIAAMLRPGISTASAIALADAHLRQMGASHNWHPTYIRFGADSQSPAVHPTDRQRVLGEDDILVVDIGPVWDGYEGDYGDTFSTGANADQRRCAEAARQVFARTRLAWLDGLTGEALYDIADVYAREYGCTVVREIAGHRVADFPHALYGKHQLANADFIPADGIWVLEIQVRDLTLPIGAFYEDVLLRPATAAAGQQEDTATAAALAA